MGMGDIAACSHHCPGCGSRFSSEQHAGAEAGAAKQVADAEAFLSFVLRWSLPASAYDCDGPYLTHPVQHAQPSGQLLAVPLALQHRLLRC